MERIVWTWAACTTSATRRCGGHRAHEAAAPGAGGDYRDDDTGVHMVRIGYLAEALAAAGPARGFARCAAAPMHDVGKIGIPTPC
jgi:putative two-component system response regulator